MSDVMEVPQLSDLEDLPVEVSSTGEPGVVILTSWANDGSTVTFTWNEMARSIHVRWVESGEVRLLMEREAATKVSVRECHGRIELWVWFNADSLGGKLVVRVGDRVHISDALLRK